MKRTLIFLFLGLAALLWGETVINGSRSILGAWDAGSATATIPAKVGTTAPATCTVGEQFFDSDATAGSNILLCTATDTWTAVTGGGGGDAEVDCAPNDPSWVCVFEEFAAGANTTAQLGTHGWYFSGTASINRMVWPYIGVARLTTGTTSGNNASIRLNMDLDNWHDFTDDYVMEAKWIFKLNSTADMTVRLGVHEGAPEFGRGAGLYGTNGGNFQIGYTTGLSSATYYDLGVPMDTNWHTFRVRADGTTARKFYYRLDSGTEVSLCESGCDMNTTNAAMWYGSNIATTGVLPRASIVTNTSAAKSLDLDYFSFKAKVNATAGVR